MSSEPATLIVAGDDEGRGLQQLKPTGEPPHTEARSRSRTWRAAPLAASPQPALSSSRGVAHARSSVLARPVCMARCGAEWGQCRRTKGERAREATPRVENVSVRRGLRSATRPPPAGRQGPGHGSAPPTAQRAPSRPGASVPKDVRIPSRRQAARICHSTERSIVGITTSGGSSMLPTRAGCQHHQPERVSGRARAHMCVCSARLGPRTCARAHVGGIITQPLSAST